MVGILVFANWAQPAATVGLWYSVYAAKWLITGICALLLAFVLVAWFELNPGKVVLVSSVTVVLALRFSQSPLVAALAGVFMYFATLTEVPILQGLIGNGMGQGPALALLLAGPALSLPNMLALHSILGTKKTVVFIALVVVMATISGVVYGSLFAS
ncbi:permease [Leptolyngbya ectocarpi]|uniref:permease n=1 Tax=Leptolyngbya ectocarpi TaxID=1202 RepID=UPI001D13EC21|nr:permease [Leptolyngbya ectocarpi]